MNKVTILTDSSAYLPKDVIADLPVATVPLTLTWEGVTYRDGIDIQPDEFYERMKTSNTLPITSQVSVHEYKQAFEKIIDSGSSVLSLGISSGISGSINSAIQARSYFKDAPIEIMETKLVSMALGFQVLAVARAAKDGADMKECLRIAREAYDHIGVYFVVETLKYLHAGGRIGGAKRFLGTALKIKPILMIADGKIEAAKSVFTTRKAIEAMVSLVEKGIDGKKPVHISVFHAGIPEQAKELLDRCVEQFDAVEGVLSCVSPVIGSHVGPGTISIAYMAGM